MWRSIKDWGIYFKNDIGFLKELRLPSVQNKNKSSRYNVQGIDSVWNNKKGVAAIVKKIEEFLSFYPWIVFYVASNNISFGHKGTPTTHSMFHNSSYKILLQLICLSSLRRNICRSPYHIKNVHAFNLILDMYIIMCARVVMCFLISNVERGCWISTDKYFSYVLLH